MKKYTSAEKSELYGRVLALVDSGKPVTAAVKEVGVSYAQFNSWKKNFSGRTGFNYPVLTAHTAEMRTPDGQILIIACNARQLSEVLTQISR